MKLAIMGTGGRMGRALAHAVQQTEGCAIAGGTEAPGSKFIGRDIGDVVGLSPLGVAVTDKPLDLFTKIDGILDFTVPSATVEFATLTAQARLVHIIGTTGFTEDQEAQLKAAARHATIVKAGNMSLGINLLAALVRQVSSTLDEEYDIEIVEIHHRHKVDAPSGTSLMLGEAAATGRGISLKDHEVRIRDGQIGERGRGDIGFASLRGGDIVGDHSVIFAGPGERIELTHKADNRAIFARGAVKAALWARGKSPGLYSMDNVLGI